MTLRQPSPKMVWSLNSPEIIDLLATTPATKPFTTRVKDLHLSRDLEAKALLSERIDNHIHFRKPQQILTVQNEKELAGEVLLRRHNFTELVLKVKSFRQAALSVIQNIYLFQNRRIFFATTTDSPEQQRQEALLLFGDDSPRQSLPLEKTFRHLLLARIWNRIISGNSSHHDNDFKKLHQVVEHLNTLRNIYMILSTNLVKKLASRINTVYQQSISYEDAVQIGSFGIARASYRYHQSSGVRFSTYAANWIKKEVQRQALAGRLIKISTNNVEQYSRAIKEGNRKKAESIMIRLTDITTAAPVTNNQPSANQSIPRSPEESAEKREMENILKGAVEQILSPKSGDIIKRRYGLPPYGGKEQSIAEISTIYGVTRGAIYQQEKKSLQKLRRHIKITTP